MRGTKKTKYKAWTAENAYTGSPARSRLRNVIRNPTRSSSLAAIAIVK